MSLLQRAFQMKPMAVSPPPHDDFWWASPSYSVAGVKVTSDLAMRITSVMACVRLLSDTLATLPPIVYKETSEGSKERLTDHDLHRLLRVKPNAWQTAAEFFEMMQGHAVLTGNAFAQYIVGRRGREDELVPIHPSRVKVELLPNRRRRYHVRNKDGSISIFLQDEILHVMGLTRDGIIGMNPIEYAAQSMGLTIAAERFGAKFFEKGASPAGALRHPSSLSEDAHLRLKKSIGDNVQGVDNAASTMILEEGMEWQNIGVPPEHAQFLETRKFQRSDIAGLFRVPPHMIGDLDRATFTNIEHQSIQFVVYSMRPWFVKWEQAIAKTLIPEEEGIKVEFLADALLRGDTQSRYEAYVKAINNGIMSPNEVRRLENLNPVEGLDVYMLPLNLQPTGPDAESLNRDEPDTNVDEDATDTNIPSQIIYNRLVDDLADRIVVAELRAFEKRVSKAKGDLGRFEKWTESFYEKQKTYVEKVMAPLASMVKAMSIPFDTERVLSYTTTEQRDRWLTKDPETEFLSKAEHYKPALKSVINGAIGYG